MYCAESARHTVKTAQTPNAKKRKNIVKNIIIGKNLLWQENIVRQLSDI
jgi:hypothetical protein